MTASTLLARVGLVGCTAVSTFACGGPERSPFFLWDLRPGMPLDSAEQFLRRRDELRPAEPVWEQCDGLDPGVRRCVHRTLGPSGNLTVVAAEGRILYLGFAPDQLELSFDDSLSRMEQRWARSRGVKMDPGGVSEEHPKGIAQFKNGRWRALLTFNGKNCGDSGRPICPALIQLLDWRAARKYADLTVPQ